MISSQKPLSSLKANNLVSFIIEEIKMNPEVTNVEFDFDLDEYVEDILSRLSEVTDNDLYLEGSCQYRGDKYRFFVVEEHCLTGGITDFQQARFAVWIEFDGVVENIIPTWAENDVTDGYDDYQQEIEENLHYDSHIRVAIKTLYYLAHEKALYES